MDGPWQWLLHCPPPTDEGWYSALRMWDPHEGMFPVAARWSGSAWFDNVGQQMLNVIAYLPTVWADADKALDEAYANDPEDG